MAAQSPPSHTDKPDLCSWINAPPAQFETSLAHLIGHLRWCLTHPQVPLTGLSHVLDAATCHIVHPLEVHGSTKDAKFLRCLLRRIREYLRCESSNLDETGCREGLSELLGFAVKLQITVTQCATEEYGATDQRETVERQLLRLNKLKLKDIDKEILLIIGDQTLICKEIAHKSGKLSDNGYLRGRLSDLKKRGILDSPGRGYFVHDEYRWVMTALQMPADVTPGNDKDETKSASNLLGADAIIS